MLPGKMSGIVFFHWPYIAHYINIKFIKTLKTKKNLRNIFHVQYYTSV